LIAIAAVLFGGLESFAGAIIAGLAIGILQMLTITYIAPLLPGETTMMIPFVFLLAILVIKAESSSSFHRAEEVQYK